MEIPPVPYFITVGMTVFGPGEQHPNRRNLGIFDLIWMVKGVLYIAEEDKQWELSEGQTLLLLPDRFHYATKPCEVETIFYWIHFDFTGDWNVTEESAAPAHPIGLPWVNRYTIQIPQYTAQPSSAMAQHQLQRFMDLSSENRSNAFWNQQQLFMDLLRMLEERGRKGSASPAMKLAEKTEAYIKQHYQTDLTNEALAEALHFHPNYIVRCMKEAYHCTPMDYLHEYRLEQAKLMLIKTEWPVAQIAETVGFRHTPYFSSCFKKYAGISPLRFRKQYSS
jgi:AraC-like DNA-binding protein